MTPTTVKPENVIFVLVDTVRADHTSFHGYERPTTPFLEELATESIVFERARSQAGCTYPSVNSFLTSRYPFDFYRRGPDDMGIPEAYPSMAEILKRNGYTTIAVSASPIVRSTPSKHNPSAGFGCVNRRALELLDGLQEPFFLYLHYMDPHDFYQAPSSYRKFAEEYEGFDFIADGNPNPIGEMLYDNGPTINYSEADIQYLVDLYDDEILYFDIVFGKLVGALRNSGVLDRSMLVVTSDHGEEFLEHGHVKHCRGVWNTLTHVPLLLRLPGSTEPKRVDSSVQLVDLLPTVLDYLDLAAEEIEMEGNTMRPLIEGSPTTSRFSFSDQSKYRGVDDGRFHLILDGIETSITLFDTHTDPLELQDIYSEGHPGLETLALELDKWLDRTGQRVRFDLALAAAKAQEDQLRALGYLE